jgi:hypothetical protein
MVLPPASCGVQQGEKPDILSDKYPWNQDALAKACQVETTLSGLSEMDSIPLDTNQ